MKKAEEGNLVLLFMDASHFVLGAIDYVTKRILTVTNDSYITATEVCDMLRKVASEYPGKTIHIILDNARYQKCALVQTLAKESGIVLTYIPSYSPNLNLIERVWKFVKAELRSKYYDDFSAFQTKIDSIIESTSKGNLAKIKRLIGEKVQLFDDMKPITENTFDRSTKRQIHAA